MFFGLSFASRSAFVVGFHPHSRTWFRTGSVTCSPTKGGSMVGFGSGKDARRNINHGGHKNTELPHKETGESSRVGDRRREP